MLHNDFDRRDLLKLAAALPLAGSARVFATPATETRLLVVFLRGAYDSSSVLVPITSDFYYASRPNIAVARPNPANPAAALPLDHDYGLNPAFRNTLYPFWAKRELAFVPFTGTSDLTRSHFETQAAVERGLASTTGALSSTTGFMGRLAGVLAGSSPMAFTDRAPLIFRGGPAVPNIAAQALGQSNFDPKAAALIARMYSKDALNGAVSAGFGASTAVSKALATEMVTSGQGAIHSDSFEGAARKIGRVMASKYTLGFVDVGGWDTHVDQGGGGGGGLAFTLNEFGKGLAGFAAEIGPAAWKRTVVVVISEFGRTFHENGSRGTDHGHGTAYWLMGGMVAGGKLHGEQVRLTPATLNQGRDLPVLNDYRGVLGGLFARMYGLNAAQVDKVFPGAKPAELGLI